MQTLEHLTFEKIYSKSYIWVSTVRILTSRRLAPVALLREETSFLYLLLRASSLSLSAKQLAATASPAVANIDFTAIQYAERLLARSRNRSYLFSPTCRIGQGFLLKKEGVVTWVFKIQKKVDKLFCLHSRTPFVYIVAVFSCLCR